MQILTLKTALIAFKCPQFRQIALPDLILRSENALQTLFEPEEALSRPISERVIFPLCVSYLLDFATS